MKLEFSRQVFEKYSVANYLIRLMGSKLFHADGRTDRHDEANSRFSQSCERACKLVFEFSAGWTGTLHV